MKAGELIKTTRPVRSQKTGVVLPREGTIISTTENLGRTLVLVNFGQGREEYLFPDEIVTAEERRAS